MRTEQEIQDMLDDSMPEGADHPTRWPGMTYEQGVDAALRWAAGWTDESPMAD